MVLNKYIKRSVWFKRAKMLSLFKSNSAPVISSILTWNRENQTTVQGVKSMGETFFSVMLFVNLCH